MQNVTQCYFTYVTEYSDGIQEKCVDFYWKTCKIAFKERVFNATTRNCKRPLIKKCDDGSTAPDAYGSPGGNFRRIGPQYNSVQFQFHGLDPPLEYQETSDIILGHLASFNFFLND